MALPIEVEKLEDLDEGLREHYVKHGEKYRLEGKEEAEARDKKKMLDAGKVDELLEKQKEQLDGLAKQKIDKLAEENATLSALNRKLLLTDVLKAEALKESAHESALDDIVYRADVWQIEDGKPVAVDKEGAPILKEGRHITMKEWLTDLQQAAPHLFKQSQGGKTPPGKGNGHDSSGARKWADLSSEQKSDAITEYGTGAEARKHYQ
jgi:hypothetical protein